MKLYSKHHIVLAVVCTVFAVTALFACGFAIRSAVVAAKASDAAFVAESFVATENTAADATERDSGYLLPVASNTPYTQDELQNINVYDRCSPAVVNISTQVISYNWFWEAVPQEGGTGSGSIIDERGYVVTNVHVIDGAYKIYISLSDGTQYEGTVVGEDPQSDIAVIKFDPPAGVNIQTIPFGDSDSLRVGQKMLAIGNPFGFDRTLTTGIISGLGRPIKSSDNVVIRDMIQTDTAINPGNSGGPLLDTQGRMVGINTMIYSTSGSSAGIGFAVPVNTAKRVVADLIQYGVVKRGKINATLIPLTTSIANYARLYVTQGLLVSEIARGSKASLGGLTAGTQAVQYGSRYNSTTIYLGGDVITAVEGTSVTTLADYNSLLESKKPGDKITVTVQRGSQSIDLLITLD